MVLALIGESCTGKSTMAKKIKAVREAELYSGKDYLRLAKSETEAARAFAALLLEHETDGGLLIYVVSEKEQLGLLPPGAARVLITAGLPLIKERFAARTGGVLPPPLAAMLERKHGMFDKESCALHIGAADSGDEALQKILALIDAQSC